MPIRPSRPLLPSLLLVVLAAGCSDQALVDRVAQVEASQDRLRASLTELGAPDPEELAQRDAAAAQVALLLEQVTTLETAIATLGADVDGQVTELDGRLTGLELVDDDLVESVAQLEAAVAALTDRVTSLKAQFDAHRADASGHGG